MELRRERNDFIRLSAQLIAQSLVTALVGAADAIMSGKLAPQALSAITLAGQVMQLFNFFIMSLCVGSTVLASQYYGAGDLDSVRKVMNITLKTSLAGSAAFFLMTLLIPRGVMSFFTDEETLISIGTPYLRLISPAFLFMGFSQIYMNIMKNTGNARQSSLFGVITATLNIILNYILIFGRCGLPQLGVTGAAAATTAARTVELILSVVFSQKGTMRFSLSGLFRRENGIRRKFWRYTLPPLLQMNSWRLAVIFSVAIVGHMGDDIVTASSYVLIVYTILGSIADGYASAVGIRVGRYLGRGETQKAKQTGDRLLISSLLLAVCMGAIVCLCIPTIIRANSVMTDKAQEYLRVLLFFTAFRCLGRFFNTTLSNGLFSAGGDVMYLLKTDIIDMWLVTLPLGVIAAYVLHLSPVAIYIVLNLEEFYKLYFMIRRYRTYLWAKNLTKKEWAPPGRYQDGIRSEILRRMPLGVIVISSAGRIVLANPAAAELLGKELSDIEGSNYIDFFMQDVGNSELADLVIEAVSDKEKTHEALVSCSGPDGTFPLSVRSSFMEDEECRIGICLMIERK